MNATPATHYEPGRYELRVRGHLDDRWAAWFGGLALTHESDGTTTGFRPGSGTVGTLRPWSAGADGRSGGRDGCQS